jgi:hypothetical protein
MIIDAVFRMVSGAVLPVGKKGRARVPRLPGCNTGRFFCKAKNLTENCAYF